MILPIAACGGSQRDPAEGPAPVPDPVGAAVVRAETVTVVRGDPAVERELAQAQLRVLEQSAQIEHLQRLLDEAQREVVRSLAKLQTSASRAEAASAMAEAEIVVQSIRRSSGQGADLRRAQKLMSESSDEFNKENYGGALYLANQVKDAGAQRAGGTSDEPLRPGETAFSGPVPMETNARANVREGPGTGFRVLFTLERGAALTGQSHANGWIRIRDDQNRTGWIIQGLVTGK